MRRPILSREGLRGSLDEALGGSTAGGLRCHGGVFPVAAHTEFDDAVLGIEDTELLWECVLPDEEADASSRE